MSAASEVGSEGSGDGAGGLRISSSGARPASEAKKEEMREEMRVEARANLADQEDVSSGGSLQHEQQGASEEEKATAVAGADAPLLAEEML